MTANSQEWNERKKMALLQKHSKILNKCILYTGQNMYIIYVYYTLVKK